MICLQGQVMITIDGGKISPSGSRLSPLTLESANALLSPLGSHGQQLIALLHDNFVSQRIPVVN